MKKKKKGGYGVVYQDVMRNKNISPEAKAIYAYLSSIAGDKNQCYPSVDLIHKEMGMSKGRLSKYMKELVSAGVIIKERTKNGNLQAGNIYKITHEAEDKGGLNSDFEPIENRVIENEPLPFEPVEDVATNNNNTNNNNINNNKDNNIIYCPEPEKSAPDRSGIKLPLSDQTFYDVPLGKIEIWRDAYPAVDVEQELKKMIAWLDANPKKGKTRKGIERFINNWLDRSQNQGGTKAAGYSREEPFDESRRSAEDYYKQWLGGRND